MDKHQGLANVIRQAIADAWSEGQDDTGQTNAAIRKVMEVRRDIGSSEALALVERGATPLGIVYATDARAGNGVAIVGAFPTGSHPPIRYPLARLAGSRNRDAEAFRRFLLSPTGHAILARYGFSAP